MSWSIVHRERIFRHLIPHAFFEILSSLKTSELNSTIKCFIFQPKLQNQTVEMFELSFLPIVSFSLRKE